MKEERDQNEKWRRSTHQFGNFHQKENELGEIGADKEAIKERNKKKGTSNKLKDEQ